jgi:threonine dehydrogenase-like Zn-dependent dehydrogenase
MTAMSTRTMRAYVLTGPGEGDVQDVPAPVAALGEVVVDVERVGVCGTDVEFFNLPSPGVRVLPDASRA